mgnify:CR=1 FL=1
MGGSQSTNTASALADIATDVTQQTSVSQSQVANVQQSINLGAGEGYHTVGSKVALYSFSASRHS